MGATFISYPFDLMRTRQSLQKGSRRHVLSMAQSIICKDGVAGLYRGLGPSLAQVMPYMGVAFASFSYFKSYLSAHLGPSQTDILAGGASGIVSKFCMMPADVIRKRLQIQGSNYEAYVMRDLPTYKGLTDCIQMIFRREGIRGFFSGLTLALLKSAPATMTTFVVYGLLHRIY